uniref:Galectin n=1 Tax=Heligmosomoides polygyrus TaxID=6339 RepID=A0A183FBB3_HELPZ
LANAKVATFAHRVPFGPVDIIEVNGEATLIGFHFLGCRPDGCGYPSVSDSFQVTRNACIGGNWGQEERQGQFPFQRDRGFDLSIANQPNGLHIFANNARFATFNHRGSAPISDYTGLKISGDVRMLMVRTAP